MRTKVLARQRGWDLRQSLREKIGIIVFGSFILAAANLLCIVLLYCCNVVYFSNNPSSYSTLLKKSGASFEMKRRRFLLFSIYFLLQVPVSVIHEDYDG